MILVGVISDVICPWCYIGKRRLVAKMGSEREQAVAYGLQASRGRRLQPAQVRSLLPTG